MSEDVRIAYRSGRIKKRYWAIQSGIAARLRCIQECAFCGAADRGAEWKQKRH